MRCMGQYGDPLIDPHVQAGRMIGERIPVFQAADLWCNNPKPTHNVSEEGK